MNKYGALGELIRMGRTQAGLDQDALASQLGVRQQAVSGWERGASRPRYHQISDVCRTLGLDMDAATEAGRYREATVASATRLLSLPFENLSDEAFEAFCADLFAFMNPGASVSRNGSTGQTQLGVDVYLSSSGRRTGIQCKRRENFGPADVNKVVKGLKPESGVHVGIIALSRRTASAAARLELARHPSWRLLDGEDLSRSVRELPVDKALRLVDTYFDGLRERFLGVRQPSPWLTLNEFDPGLPGRLAVERAFTMVGRDGELGRLRDLVESGSPLVLLVGRGGIGKTRLLRELAATEPDREVRFVRPGPISPQAFELLPEGSPVIIIDDATDMEHDLLSLVGGITEARPQATVIFSTRPRSLPHLRARFEIAEPDAGSLTVELGDLSTTDAEALAAEALSDSATNDRVAKLAAVGYDCPFLIVIAAHLLRGGKLTDRDLGSQDTLRQLILDRFASIVVSGPRAQEMTRLLASLAAVQPVPINDPQFLSVVADLARLEVDQVLGALDELEDLGLVLRRGHSVRVVPDLLGDSLLDRALVSESGIDKGFAARIADRAAGRSLTNAIRNISIIDWRKRADAPSELAGVLWSALTDHALTLPNSERISLGNSVAQVAAIYPEQALNLVDDLLANPAQDEEDPMSRLMGDDSLITTATVLRSLTRLISNAGHRRAHLDRAMSLLVRASRTESRRENNSPDHAFRLLRELGEYSSGQDVPFYVTFAESVATMLEAEEHAEVRAESVGLLKSLLATQFTVTRSRGISITMSRHHVDFDRVAPVRGKALSIARASLSEGGPVAMKAIEVLGAGLQSEDREAAVDDEFAGIVATLRQILGSSDARPGLRLAAYRTLGWHATYGRGARRRLVREARSDLLRDDAYLIARQVRSGWNADDDDDDDEDADAGERAVARFHRAAEANAAAVEELVDRWIARGDAALLLARVREAMEEENATGSRPAVPELLLLRLMGGSPDLAHAVVAGCLGKDDDGDSLARLALRVLLEMDDADAEAYVLRLLDEDETRAQVAASALTNARIKDGRARERLFRRASRSKHPAVHRILLSAGRWFEPAETGLLLELLHAAPIESDSQVAAEAITLFAYGRKHPWISLPRSERANILNRLERTPKLPDHELGVLLNAEMAEDPWVVLALLKSRVDLKESTENYDALPYLEAVGLDFAEAPDLPLLIDDIVEWILAGEVWQRAFYGEQLLKALVQPYGAEAKGLIRRLIASRSEVRIRLARTLLGEAPQTFVVDEADFVADLIELAQQMPEELGSLVMSGLHGSAYLGMRSRSIGVDDPSEVVLRDRGSAIAAAFAEGSPGRTFYDEVSRYATERLRVERADDRRLEEPRNW